MKIKAIFVVTLVVLLGVITIAEEWPTLLLQNGARVVEVAIASYSQVTGRVAYQGPVLKEGEENWKDAHTYTGVKLEELLGSVGGMNEGQRLWVQATDGWHKELPYQVIYKDTPCGTAILALSRDEDEADEWEDAPMLVFLPEDERFSNADMLGVLGEELSHYYADCASTTGLLVKNVAYLIVDYAGGALPTRAEAAAAVSSSEGRVLTVVRGARKSGFTMAGLEALDPVTAPGTFTNSLGTDYTATYTGVPISTLIGDVPTAATVRVTASDGYSMNYPARTLLDRSGGTWILAFKENGDYMPHDPGPLRLVQVGEDNPHFEGAISARMVERLEVLGAYEGYSLLVQGELTRSFDRAELEAGIGCLCHTSSVTVTHEGVTHTYSGLPLWRLIAYVDDERFPEPEQGIHYDEGDFNDALAAEGYTVSLLAEDGYAQSVSSRLIARDDRFIVAFKRDGDFLDPEKEGVMRFVYDDSVLLPAGTRLTSVRFLVGIKLDL